MKLGFECSISQTNKNSLPKNVVHVQDADLLQENLDHPGFWQHVTAIVLKVSKLIQHEREYNSKQCLTAKRSTLKVIVTVVQNTQPTAPEHIQMEKGINMKKHAHQNQTLIKAATWHEKSTELPF